MHRVILNTFLPRSCHNPFGPPQQRQRTVPLSPSYLQELATANSASRSKEYHLRNHHYRKWMNLIRVVSDEKTMLESQVCVEKWKEKAHIYPSAAGRDVGHRRLT
jgi:hypothetical protein